MKLIPLNQTQLSENDNQLLIKVPDPVYQIWYDSAYGMAAQGCSVEYRQKNLFKQLQEWIAYKYPGYGIVAFDDFNAKDAKKIQERTGYPVTWGMYVLLERGSSMQQVNLIDKLLEEGNKTITDGRLEE